MCECCDGEAKSDSATNGEKAAVAMLSRTMPKRCSPSTPPLAAARGIGAAEAAVPAVFMLVLCVFATVCLLACLSRLGWGVR